MAIDFTQFSEFDKDALEAAKKDWNNIQHQGLNFYRFLHEQKDKLDPLKGDYLADVRRLELLPAVSQAYEADGKLKPFDRKDHVAHTNLEKAMNGYSPTGNPLPSQHIAAELGRHDVMNEGMRDKFFKRDHTGNLVSKALHNETVNRYLDKASQLTGTWGKLAKVGAGVALGVGAAVSHAREAPEASAGDIAMTGLRQAADFGINGLGDLMDGKSCEGGVKVLGWAAGTVVGLVPVAGGVIGGYVEDKVGELGSEACRKANPAQQTPRLKQSP